MTTQTTKATGFSPAPSNKPGTTVTDRLRALATNQTAVLVAIYILMVIVFTTINSSFFSTAVFGNILLDWGPIMLMAVGETYVIVSAGIDLSVGATLGLSGVVAAMLMRSMTHGGQSGALSIVVGTLVAAALGLFVGLVNAFLINGLRLVPFIATLATMGAGEGLSIVITGGTPVAEGPPSAVTFGVTTYARIFTAPILIVIAIVIVAALYLHCSRMGRWTFAIGSNAFAARGAGINVDRHIYRIYGLSGLLAGLAGMLVYLRLGSGSPSSGVGDELQAIAAVVIGGASLFGGIGRMAGTVLGALIITSVLSGLIIVGVEANWQQVVISAIIVVAVGSRTIGSGLRRASR